MTDAFLAPVREAFFVGATIGRPYGDLPAKYQFEYMGFCFFPGCVTIKTEKTHPEVGYEKMCHFLRCRI